MSTTPAALINLALLDSGIIGQGQIASAVDTNNAFTRLNMLIAQWNKDRTLLYDLQDVSFVSTGAVSYTVGTGGQFNIARPERLENGCFMRQLNTSAAVQIDYPLRPITSHEDYAQVRLKSMGTFPNSVFYDSAYPVANVYFWPVPAAAIYELHLLVRTPLQTFTDLNVTVNLPDEYQAAILYNLQVRLRAAYRMAPDGVLIGLAKDSLGIIRNSNAQVPSLRMPGRLVGRSIGYNVYSDT